MHWHQCPDLRQNFRLSSRGFRGCPGVIRGGAAAQAQWLGLHLFYPAGPQPVKQ